MNFEIFIRWIIKCMIVVKLLVENFTIYQLIIFYLIATFLGIIGYIFYCIYRMNEYNHLEEELRNLDVTLPVWIFSDFWFILVFTLIYFDLV